MHRYEIIIYRSNEQVEANLRRLEFGAEREDTR